MEIKNIDGIDVNRVVGTGVITAYTKVINMIKTANPRKTTYIDNLVADGATFEMRNDVSNVVKDKYDSYSVSSPSELSQEQIRELISVATTTKPSLRLVLPKTDSNTAKYKMDFLNRGIFLTYTTIPVSTVVNDLGFETEYDMSQYDDVLAKLRRVFIGDDYLKLVEETVDENNKIVRIELEPRSNTVLKDSSVALQEQRVISLCSGFAEPDEVLKAIPGLVPVIKFVRDAVSEEDKVGDEIGNTDLDLNQSGSDGVITQP